MQAGPNPSTPCASRPQKATRDSGACSTGSTWGLLAHEFEGFWGLVAHVLAHKQHVNRVEASRSTLCVSRPRTQRPCLQAGPRTDSCACVGTRSGCACVGEPKARVRINPPPLLQLPPQPQGEGGLEPTYYHLPLRTTTTSTSSTTPTATRERIW